MSSVQASTHFYKKQEIPFVPGTDVKKEFESIMRSIGMNSTSEREEELRES
jgi:hypothetical protein